MYIIIRFGGRRMESLLLHQERYRPMLHLCNRANGSLELSDVQRYITHIREAYSDGHNINCHNAVNALELIEIGKRLGYQDIESRIAFGKTLCSNYPPEQELDSATIDFVKWQIDFFFGLYHLI